MNIVSRYASDDRTDPIDISIVDLQNTRLGRPGIELAYFFCSSTSPEQRKNHFEDLLRFYYDQFFEQLNNLGDKSEPFFTFEELKEEYDDCYAFGFIMGCMHAQVIIIMEMFSINKYSHRL